MIQTRSGPSALVYLGIRRSPCLFREIQFFFVSFQSASENELEKEASDLVVGGIVFENTGNRVQITGDRRQNSQSELRIRKVKKEADEEKVVKVSSRVRRTLNE
jgi:hypothetical protein